MSFERANRRAALISLLEGLSFTGTGLIGAPISLSGLVKSGPLPTERPRGKNGAVVQPLTAPTTIDGLWYRSRETWHVRVWLGIERDALGDAADAPIETLRSALTGTTLGGYAHSVRDVNPTHLIEPGRLSIDVILSVEFLRPAGG